MKQFKQFNQDTLLESQWALIRLKSLSQPSIYKMATFWTTKILRTLTQLRLLTGQWPITSSFWEALKALTDAKTTKPQ